MFASRACAEMRNSFPCLSCLQLWMIFKFLSSWHHFLICGIDALFTWEIFNGLVSFQAFSIILSLLTLKAMFCLFCDFFPSSPSPTQPHRCLPVLTQYLSLLPSQAHWLLTLAQPSLPHWKAETLSHELEIYLGRQREMGLFSGIRFLFLQTQ